MAVWAKSQEGQPGPPWLEIGPPLLPQQGASRQLINARRSHVHALEIARDGDCVLGEPFQAFRLEIRAACVGDEDPCALRAGALEERALLGGHPLFVGEIAAENATGHEAQMPESPAVPRPIYTDPEIAGVGLTEAEATEKYGAENIAVGRLPWVANARAVMTGETAGWVKSIHETTYGELVGVVIVGPHATDLIEAAVVALDAEATIETVADGMAPHPTLSEGLKEAGLVALGRPIHLPPRRR